jgi:Xaa-Pro aminopeptidase
MIPSLEAKKGQQACEILNELGLDCWLVWVRETSQTSDPVLPLIFGGGLVWQSALLYTRMGEKIAIVGNLDADGLTSHGLFDRVTPYTQGIGETLRAELKRIDPGKIAINFSENDVASDGLTVGMHRLLQTYLKGTPYNERFVSAESLIGRLRGRKLPEEISRLQEAVTITERIFEEAMDFLKVGQTELEIHRFFREQIEAHGVTGAWEDGHNPAVDAGPNKAFGHVGPTENRTKTGQLLHFDFGVRCRGYCADLQRMVFFGSSHQIPGEVQRALETVRDAIGKAAEFIRSGRKGHEVDAIAREFVVKRGYREYQHALGHQMGRQAHDGGTILGPLWERYGDTPKGVLEEGNVFTLELYVTTEHYGQLSLEEDIVVTGDGCRFLSRPQQELICVPS